MKFQAPSSVTALSCAGAEIIPDAQGIFESAEIHASDLLAHGCVPAPEEAETPRAKKEKQKLKAD